MVATSRAMVQAVRTRHALLDLEIAVKYIRERGLIAGELEQELKELRTEVERLIGYVV
jgi:hypothetical protein